MTEAGPDLRPMTDADRPAFDEIWKRLVHRTRRMPTLHGLDKAGKQQDDEDARNAYWVVLEGLPLEAVRRAAFELGKTCETMPTAATWFEAADTIAAAMLPELELTAPDSEPPPPADLERSREHRREIVAKMRQNAERARQRAAITGGPLGLDWNAMADWFERLMERQGDRRPRPFECDVCEDTGWTHHTCGPDDPCGRELHGDPESDRHEYVRRCECFDTNTVIARRIQRGRRNRERRTR